MDHIHDQDTLNGNEIAVIGLACRFPGAPDLEAYWHNLQNGVESISFLTDDDLETSVTDYSADPTHPDFVRAAATIEGADLFDAQFFGYAPKDAALIDPQQRLFLEYAWMALESAGYDAERYDDPIGVFAGARTNTYVYNLLFNRAAVGNLTPFELAASNDFSGLSTRVAYKLNLRGPAYSIHTACSTGLAAVHLACQSVLIGECRMALAGGVAVNVPQQTGYLYREGGIASPDGHCRAFDVSAAGTVLGSGIGVVVLKRLEDALQDGDTIHAVIKGSAANNDGSAKASFTAPSVDGQATVILEALTVAGVEPETISYIEAHGTGTHLGDPIEIRALAKAFRSGNVPSSSVAIGSVKTNFGHLESAAGLAGLIKTILALKHKQIPPSLNFNRPNPNIQLEQTPFYVNTKLTDWQPASGLRRAGVSAFGAGGTNIHVVLEEAPVRQPAVDKQPWQVLPLSAKTATALDRAAANVADFIESQPAVALADIAYTLQAGRAQFDVRRIAVCRDRQHAVEVLRGDDPGQLFSDRKTGGERSISFMFAGQGSQYANMAAELYQHEPVFRAQIDDCLAKLKPHVDLDLRDVLYPATAGAPAERINQTDVAQPLLFVVEYALAQLLISRGIRPTDMIGHSVGEYVAACLAGVMALDDALWLIATRGKLIQTLPAGAMLAVSLPEAALRSRLPASLDLAAINGPELCVVSGPAPAIQEFAQQLANDQIETRPLQTSHAFHSRSVDAILDTFAHAAAKITLRAPQIPFISNVSGTWIRDDEATDPQYWARHIRAAVRFSDGLQTLLTRPNVVLLDVGPGRTLSRLAQRHPARQSQQLVLSALPHPKDQKSDLAFFLTALGKLWLAGIDIDWQHGYADEQPQRVPLPPYPFERQRHWIDPLPDERNGYQPSSAAPRGQERSAIDDWFYVPSWRRTAAVGPADWTQQQSWLVFAPEHDSFSEQLIAALRQAGQTVVVVYPGAQYSFVDEHSYTINPHSREDYAALAHELRALETMPQVVLHLWSLAYQPANPLTVAAFDAAQTLGFYSLLSFAQAFGESSPAAPLKLVVLSQQLHDVRGDELPRPELATLLGPCKVIPQEYPHITCRTIDLNIPDASPQQIDLIQQLLSDIRADDAEPVVALRGRHRWAQDVVPARREPLPAPTLRQSGVYLITGGLSGIGYIFAESLARTAAAKLILLDAEPLPPRETWQQWLDSYDGHDEISTKITNVRALETTGAELLVLSADFADRASVQAAVEHATARFGQIQGVIHAASVADGGLIPLRGWDAIENVFTTKAKGLIHLHAILRDQPLDFFVLFSSINALLGEFGQIDQCAANSFLGMFAQAATTATTPLTTVNWDLWQANAAMMQTLLQKAGLPAAAAERLRQEVEQGLRTDEGIAAFERIVAGPAVAEITVSVQPIQARIERMAALVGELQHVRDGATFMKQQHGRPDLQTAYVAPRSDEEQVVADIWKDVLGIEQIGIHDDFFDLGGHSLLVTMMMGRLRDALGVDIPMEKLFERPTIAGVLETKAELQSQQDSSAIEILDLLAQLSDEDAEEELRRRLEMLGD